jgi:AAA domain/UvrD-like helicase C-terminal domain
MPQVAISTDFLDALGRLPKDKQKKVRAFAEKFRANPTSKAINYEAIHGMLDPKVRTVRVDLGYRAIVIHPPEGDVYMLVWVDHHDEAMAWAKHKRFEVHPHTGSFQVWQSIHGVEQVVPAAVIPEPAAPSAPSAVSVLVKSDDLFAAHDDATIHELGVPVPLMPAVRSVRSESDLDALQAYLPAEARDALYMLAAGYTPEEARDEIGSARDAQAKPVDVADVAAALERPSSQRQFKLVADDRELSEILAAPLEKWRIFLHPSQRALVEMSSAGSARVLGGAGTGKTVVALHRARHLARLANGSEQILLTTFTANLATDLNRALDALCGLERERILVRHLHAEAAHVLRAHGVRPNILSDGELRGVWSRVLRDAGGDYPDAFYKDEWAHVVQAQAVKTEAEYLRARRVGRGTALGRAERKAVWRVLEAFRRELTRLNGMDYTDLVREARLLLRKQTAARYKHVVVDETQDLRQEDLAFVRSLCPAGPNDLFLVGDAHQRIYGHQASLARAEIMVRGRQSRRLRINYRTTQQIRAFAMKVLDGERVDDLDEGEDDARGERSLRVGATPERIACASADAEAKAIQTRVRAWIETGIEPADICVVAHDKATVAQRVRPILEQAGLAVEVLSKEPESGDRTRVRAATMHRVKGLEFRCVLIASAQECRAPKGAEYADETARLARESQERHLLYVAATRARDELVVTWFGEGPLRATPGVV